MIDIDPEVLAFIEDAFEQNYEILRLERAGVLSPDGKENARQQVLLYWRKMRDVAESVTDTEVRLSLPGQESPKGRGFAIEGVVDIVRDDKRTVMYDIKTHEADYVRSNRDLYERQLNVYAHIWSELRGEQLDETAVIATRFPATIRAALSAGDEERLSYELQRWEPLIPIQFDTARVDATVREFGGVVDAIEDREFMPRPLEDLRTRQGMSRQLFATAVCRNCDARFSCASYRAYALSGGGRIEVRFRQYLGDLGTDLERDARRTTNLNAARDTEDLLADFLG